MQQRNLRQRPPTFLLDRDHQLGSELLLLGGGAHAGSTRFHDSSPRGNHGTLTNMELTDWVWDPVLNRFVISLGGTDEHILITDPASMQLTAYPMTFSGWHYKAGSAASMAWGSGSHAAVYDGVMVRFGDAENIEIRVGDGGGTLVGNRRSTNAAGPFAYSTWLHIAAVLYAIQPADIYVDGVLQSAATSGSGGAVAYPNTNAVIGYWRSGTVDYYTAGMYSDLMIHARALSVAEIQQLADPSNVMLSGLILPPKRRLWGLPGGVADIFTAAAAMSIGGATAAASATFSPPVYTAEAPVTIGGAELSASATSSDPVYSASAALEIGTTVLAASAAFTAPVYTAAASLTSGGADLSASATFSAPVYSATAAALIGGVTCVASAEFTAPTYTATAAVTIGATTLAATAAYASSVSIATCAALTGAAVLVASGTFVASSFTAVVHYHVIEGPSKETHVLEGPSKQTHILEGPSKQTRVLIGSD